MIPIIDAHIHMDLYGAAERERLLASFAEHQVAGVVSVSMHLESCREQLRLKRAAPNTVFPAFGFHPEQPLPNRAEEQQLLQWIREQRDVMVAVGEVGLPYYTRAEMENKGEPFELEPYVRLLDRFIQLAAELDKPIVLHAVYEDADIACGLLEKHGVRRAHFHWFKGSPETLARMRDNGYMISVTPDVLYKTKIQEIVKEYPLELLMVETDGPWPFGGPFAGQRTHPLMIRESIARIAEIKGCPEHEAGMALYENTRRFYGLPLE